MVFDSLELFLLKCSPRIRYSLLMGFLSTLVALWWFLGMSTTLHALERLEHAEQECTRCQEQATHAQDNADKRASAVTSRRYAVDKRLAAAGGYKLFLKRCIDQGLDCQSSHVTYACADNGAACATLSSTCVGTFEQFYTFLSEVPTEFVAIWKKCFCKLNNDQDLEIQSDITLYTK